MLRFEWDPEKNERLKEERGVAFEEIAGLLGMGRIWRHAEHWNPERYPNQRIFLVPIDDYIYAVPYVREGDVIFLKTAFPSRKLTRQYLDELNSNE